MFEEALLAFHELIGDESTGEQVAFDVELRSADRATLLVRWLDELVYRAETEDLVPEEVERLELSADRLRGDGAGAARRASPPGEGRDVQRAGVRRWKRRVPRNGGAGCLRRRPQPCPSCARWTRPSGRSPPRRGPTCACRPASSPTRAARRDRRRSLAGAARRTSRRCPGIREAALAMPDIHQGYGFPVGGVAATEPPGGRRLARRRRLRHQLRRAAARAAADARRELGARTEALVHEISRRVPVGAGRGGALAARGRGARPTCCVHGPRALLAEHRHRHARRTSSTRSRRAASPAPTRAWCPSARAGAGRISSARSARATTSSRCSASRRSSIRPRPRRSGCAPAR